MPVSPPAYAVIVAGGSGQRVGSTTPKQFLPLAGKPVLYWSIKAFIDAIGHVCIILVLPEAFMEKGRAVLRLFDPVPDAQLVAGGDTRFASVAAGLALVPPDAIVLVHDAARPLVSREVILRCLEGALADGSAIPVVPVTDSIRQALASGNRAITREDLRIVQTPQAFRAAMLKEAFTQPYKPVFTDEASVVEWSGNAVHLVDGDRSNLKITTAEDLVIAEALLQGRNE